MGQQKVSKRTSKRGRKEYFLVFRLFFFPESDRPVPSLVLISSVNEFFQEFMIYVTIGGSVTVVSYSYSLSYLVKGRERF